MHMCVPRMSLLDPRELGLWMVVHHHLSAGTQTCVLCKSIKYSSLLSHVSSPLFILFKIYLFVYACVSVCRVSAAAQSPEQRVGPSGAGVTESCHLDKGARIQTWVLHRRVLRLTH